MSDREIQIFVCIQLILNGFLVGYYICSLLSENRQMFFRRWLQFGLIMIFLPVVSLCWGTMNLVRSVVSQMVTIGFIFLGFPGSRKKRVLVLVSTEAFSIAFELVCYWVMFLLYGMPDLTYATRGTMYLCVGMIFTNMLSFPGHVLVIAFGKVFLHQIRGRELVFYMMLPVYQFLLLFLYLAGCPEVEAATVYVGTWMLVMSLFVCFLFLFAVDTLIGRIQARESLLQLQEKRQRELDYYRKVQENLNDLRTMKHDFANQLQTVHALLRSGAGRERIVELLDAFHTLEGADFSTKLPLQNSGNQPGHPGGRLV